MQLAAWTVVCVLYSGVLARWPFPLFLTAMAIWCLIPGLASDVYTGSSGLHPATVLVVVATIVQLAVRPQLLLRSIRARPEWAVLLATVAGLSTATGFYQGGASHTDAITAALNQVVGPITVFFLLGGIILDDPSRAEVVMKGFVLLGVLESGLSIVQLVVQDPLLYGDHYADQAFFRQDLNRWMGTFDHPLLLSLFVVLAMCYTPLLRRWWLILLALGLMFGGLIVSQSRVGIVAGVVVTLFVIVRAPLRRMRERIWLLAFLAVSATVALSMGVATAVAARVADDSGSSTARADAFTYFVDHFSEYVWIGHGLNGSFAVSDNAGLGSSFESAALMYCIDVGMAATIVYFGVMASTFIRAVNTWRASAPTAAAAAALLIPQSYSALSGNTAAPMIVWVVFSVAGFGIPFAGRNQTAEADRVRALRANEHPFLDSSVQERQFQEERV